MKIRSLLLGSVAAAGLATTGYAADLGVVTSLDVCDELGLSGLTISSDDNCLVITGGVTFEYSLGDYNDGDSAFGQPVDGSSSDGADFLAFDRVGLQTVPNNDGTLDSSSDVDAWLKFVATANSDFGPATATIKLISENGTGLADATVGVDEAWVGIGDTTVIMAGYKGSIFEDGDDGPLNYLGLFNSSNVDVGVGFRPNYDSPTYPVVVGPPAPNSDLNGDGVPDVYIATAAADGDLTDPGEMHGTVVTGGNVIQVVSNLGNGLTIGVGLEDLGSKYDSLLTAVGVVKYAGDGVTAHLSSAVDTTGLWNVHAGFKGTWDPITVVGAVAAANGWWNALGSVSATFDMFTLAASAEATAGGEWGVGGSLTAAVTDGVTLNLGGRYFRDNAPANFVPGGDAGWQAEAGVAVAATETIKLTAAVGAMDSNRLPGGAFFYGKAGLAWAPGGGFDLSLDGQANTLGGYKGTFKASKSIK